MGSAIKGPGSFGCVSAGTDAPGWGREGDGLSGLGLPPCLLSVTQTHLSLTVSLVFPLLFSSDHWLTADMSTGSTAWEAEVRRCGLPTDVLSGPIR